VHVQAAQVNGLDGAHLVDGQRDLLDRNAELRLPAAGCQRRMRGRLDPWADAEQHRRPAPREPFDAVDVVEAVDDDVGDPGIERRLDVLVGLGVAMHDDRGRIGTGSQGQPELPGSDYIAAQAVRRQDPDHRHRRIGLDREADPAIAMPAGERVLVLRGPVPQSLLVENVGGRAELLGYLGEQATTDPQVVAVDRGRLGQQRQVRHARHPPPS
jgi:hypothetical protein